MVILFPIEQVTDIPIVLIIAPVSIVLILGVVLWSRSRSKGSVVKAVPAAAPAPAKPAAPAMAEARNQMVYDSYTKTWYEVDQTGKKTMIKK
jgi:hypothetical protein